VNKSGPKTGLTDKNAALFGRKFHPLKPDLGPTDIDSGRPPPPFDGQWIRMGCRVPCPRSAEVRHLLVEGGAQFVNGVHENANIFRISLGDNAMPEIENVAGPCAIRGQDPVHFGPDRVRR
jgi:hypothetical protein